MMITQNAQVVAYANDFLFMFYISLPALLVVFLMKRPPVRPGAHTYRSDGIGGLPA
jgi:isocitrate dehydrogenase kinase/phosphatase